MGGLDGNDPDQGGNELASMSDVARVVWEASNVRDIYEDPV